MRTCTCTYARTLVYLCDTHTAVPTAYERRVSYLLRPSTPSPASSSRATRAAVATAGRLAGARRELNGINGYQRTASVTVEPYCTRFAQNFRVSNQLVLGVRVFLPPGNSGVGVSARCVGGG